MIRAILLWDTVHLSSKISYPYLSLQRCIDNFRCNLCTTGIKPQPCTYILLIASLKQEVEVPRRMLNFTKMTRNGKLEEDYCKPYKKLKPMATCLLLQDGWNWIRFTSVQSDLNITSPMRFLNPPTTCPFDNKFFCK